MIVKNLQKTAVDFRELHYPLGGDFNLEDFSDPPNSAARRPGKTKKRHE